MLVGYKGVLVCVCRYTVGMLVNTATAERERRLRTQCQALLNVAQNLFTHLGKSWPQRLPREGSGTLLGPRGRPTGMDTWQARPLGTDLGHFIMCEGLYRPVVLPGGG